VKVQSVNMRTADTAEVRFTSGFEPDEASLILRIGRSPYGTGTAAIVPGSLRTDSGSFVCEFSFPAPPPELAHPGVYELFLGGSDKNTGEPFTGTTKLTVS